MEYVAYFIGAAILVGLAKSVRIIGQAEVMVVERLGAFPLPVEVTPFGYTITAKTVYDVLCAAGIDRPRVELRKQPGSIELLVTDGGNYILDCHCGRIPDAEALAARLSNVPGVVEHGLFIDIARTVIIGNENGATVFEF